MEAKKILIVLLILGLLFVATLAIATPSVSAALPGYSGVGSGKEVIRYCSSESMSLEEYFKCMT